MIALSTFSVLGLIFSVLESQLVKSETNKQKSEYLCHSEMQNKQYSLEVGFRTDRGGVKVMAHTYEPHIPDLEMLRRDDGELEASLVFVMANLGCQFDYLWNQLKRNQKISLIGHLRWEEPS